MTDNLEEVLGELYRNHLAQNDDPYLRIHAGRAFLSGTIRFFRFYEPYLKDRRSILDWGCRHAPDACLIRAALGPDVALSGCDVLDAQQYDSFYRYSDLEYRKLTHHFRVPYADGEFDAVIASGVLEHVPMDYESLKELHRVLKTGGRLIIGYLPNRWSVEEWWIRARGRNDWHRRLYSHGEFRRLLMRAGFLPMITGFQTRADMLNRRTGATALLRRSSLPRLTSSLCGVAGKTLYF